MTLVFLLITVLAFGGMTINRNAHRRNARHWDYIASRLRLELVLQQQRQATAKTSCKGKCPAAILNSFAAGGQL